MGEIEKQSVNKNLNRGNPAWGSRSQGTGKSGNLNGKPRKDFCITSLQKEKLLEVCPFDSQGRSWIEALAEGGLRQALALPVAMSSLLDRHEGKIPHSLSGADGGPVVFKVVREESPPGGKNGSPD